MSAHHGNHARINHSAYRLIRSIDRLARLFAQRLALLLAGS